jgi:GDP-4-dehydro-6-deoxy-D-mannose reductase
LRPTLITGATGFAGGHLVDRLAGREPIVAWHRPETRPPIPASGVRWQGIDIRDRESVASAIAEARPGRIYHVAGAPRVDTSWTDVVPHLETNVLGTHHLLKAVKRAGLDCRVLVVSSAMVYAVGPEPLDESADLRPSSPYGVSKLAQDDLSRRAVTEWNLDVVVARPFNHIGPRQDPGFAVSSFARQVAFIEAGRAEAVIEVGNLDARRDFTDVRDVAAAYEALMSRGRTGRAYNICSGRGTRISDVLSAVLALSRTPVRVAVDPTLLRPSDMPVFVGNASRIRDEAGWSPERSLEQTLADTLDWWRARVSGISP